MIDEFVDSLGGVDVFVNNSGTSRNGPFLDLSWEDWSHTLDVDLNAYVIDGGLLLTAAVRNSD